MTLTFVPALYNANVKISLLTLKLHNVWYHQILFEVIWLCTNVIFSLIKFCDAIIITYLIS